MNRNYSTSNLEIYHLFSNSTGLTDDQLCQVFDILDHLKNARDVYDRWIQSIPSEKVTISIASYECINLNDIVQRDDLFRLLSHNMYVIDFWLCNVVFPHELKIFPQKLMCSAWDLCSENLQHQVTGFSGTNDTKNILPLPIVQNDLKQLENTNEEMRKLLMQPKNQSYESMPANVSGKYIIKKLIGKRVPVLLDSGALMLELNNEEVAIEWLKLSSHDSFDAAVYFDSNDVLQTIDRNGTITAFDCSVYRENLIRCVVYLDDIHTRGTDLKFPSEWKAVVTLSGDITRDKTVQACMRMRQLKSYQSISFWASHETDIRIRELCNLSMHEDVTNEDVFKFICNNSQQFETINMIHWTVGALNYTKKFVAHRHSNTYRENNLKNLYKMCADDEIIKLIDMYGEKHESLLIDTVHAQFKKFISNNTLHQDLLTHVANLKNQILKKISKQAPNLKQYANNLEEEQEKEVELELELEQEQEEQLIIERPKAQPAKPKLDQRLKDLILNGFNDIGDIMKKDGSLQTISQSLSNTNLSDFFEKNSKAWSDHLFITNDFKTVLVKNSSKKCNDFIRPVWWIGQVERTPETDYCLILLSSHECNKLLPTFRTSKKSTLFMYRPRLSAHFSNFLHVSNLCVSGKTTTNQLNMKDEIQIGIYSGLTYFGSKIEQDEYCAFLGLIPHPRNPEQNAAFEEGIIQPNGFVPIENRQHSEAISSSVGQCKFLMNPTNFVIEMIKAHHQAMPKISHTASILLRGRKPIEDN